MTAFATPMGDPEPRDSSPVVGLREAPPHLPTPAPGVCSAEASRRVTGTWGCRKTTFQPVQVTLSLSPQSPGRAKCCMRA